MSSSGRRVGGGHRRVGGGQNCFCCFSSLSSVFYSCLSSCLSACSHSRFCFCFYERLAEECSPWVIGTISYRPRIRERRGSRMSYDAHDAHDAHDV